MPLWVSAGSDDRPIMESNWTPMVVGVDGSPAAAAALNWAGMLATTVGAEVVAVSAFKNPWSEVNAEDHQRLLKERDELLGEAWVRPARHVGATVRPMVNEGDPRDVIMEVAEAEDASLIVLGRTGEGGGPGFLHLGSAVEHIAHHTRRPLAVIPTISHRPIERILIGVDGSAESQHAIHWCAELVPFTGATVTAVVVKEPYLEWTPDSSPDNWRRDAERRIGEWMAPVAERGTDVEAIAKRDLHPADGLLGVASARGADLLVIGTRGAGRVSNLRVGGVAMKVLHRASIPIVLVPPKP